MSEWINPRRRVFNPIISIINTETFLLVNKCTYPSHYFIRLFYIGEELKLSNKAKQILCWKTINRSLFAILIYMGKMLMQSLNQNEIVGIIDLVIIVCMEMVKLKDL